LTFKVFRALFKSEKPRLLSQISIPGIDTETGPLKSSSLQQQNFVHASLIIESYDGCADAY